LSATVTPFTAGDYRTDLKPVWCAGCGDFGVLTALYRAMAEQQWKPWETVVISGIGCSSRLPGYVATYGFNTVHGRALPLATGVRSPARAARRRGRRRRRRFRHRREPLPPFVPPQPRRDLHPDGQRDLRPHEGAVGPDDAVRRQDEVDLLRQSRASFDPCEVAISVGATWVGRAFSGT